MLNLMEGLSLLALVAVLAFAVTRPKGLPEAVAAVPAALLLVLVGALGWRTALDEMHGLAGTAGFLAAVLVLSHLCQSEGLFDWAGAVMAHRSTGKPQRLLVLVFVVASLTTAVLSLDATVVLLTPVVFATAARIGARPKPHVYATAHLANSASLLLPVSNLTNLLAMQASGLAFGTFAAIMALPWLVALGIEYLVMRRHFAGDLRLRSGGDDQDETARMPRYAVAVLLLVLAGFLVCSALHVEAAFSAVAGVLLLGGKRLVTEGDRGGQLKEMFQAMNLWFVAFVLALGIVVKAVVDNGLSGAMGHLVPAGNGLVSMLLLALLAAVLANVVNNLPAVLVLLPLAAPGGPAAVLSVLIGVNIGPNLTYVGSLATLLWRRIVADHDHDTEVGEFTRLGVASVPAQLLLCTAALWAATRVMGV